MLVALVPFWFLRRMRAREREVMLRLVAVYVCLSLFMVILLNPPPGDLGAVGLVELFFPPSYVVLSVWTGVGLVLLGTVVGRAGGGTGKRRGGLRDTEKHRNCPG